jgi:pimeloyl-ACP methyl ester carboxylesterase
MKTKPYAIPRKVVLLVSILLSYFCMSVSNAATHHIPAKQNRYISYTEIGQGEPLVLIHAFPTDQQLWVPQQEGLKQHFRVITLDLWGFGRSDITDGQAITMTEYADEIKQLLDQLHIKKAIIGGESMGGYIALAFLQKYPNEVNGLILSDTQSIADSPEAKIKREATAVDILEHGTTQLINGFIPKALSPNASEQKRIFLHAILAKQSATAIASALRGMALRDDTSNIIANTTSPVLIITGDQDILISPQQSQNMHVLAKNSKLTTISNAGHLSSFEQSDAWNQAVVSMFYKTK